MKASRGLAVVFWILFISWARADWVTYSLPNLTYSWGATALAHLPDGRYLFAENGNFSRQDAWNNSAYSSFAGEPAMDPSFIAVWDGTHAAAGLGGWGASDVDIFNPSSLTAPEFANIGLSLQNFHGVYRDAGGLFTGGGDTGTGGDHHGLRYISLQGGTNRLVIDDISTYSCGFASDEAGNLFVGDNDDGRVYKFTRNQLDNAIENGPLAITDGQFVHDFGGGGNIGSMAVDGLGRIWACGWQENGIKIYNPNLDQEFTVIPNLNNSNYKVAAFTRNGEQYISFMNQADPGQNGSAQYYGFDLAGNYAIPEPGTLFLLVLGLLAPLVAILRKQWGL